jgi:hypothetical protein
MWSKRVDLWQAPPLEQSRKRCGEIRGQPIPAILRRRRAILFDWFEVIGAYRSELQANILISSDGAPY